ncbi:MAG: hypothetical protein SFY80_11005 [Verrucomicrobiota bacterium]|nr:hypothetical protein [Verrucomicrobiota bacterium]
MLFNFAKAIVFTLTLLLVVISGSLAMVFMQTFREYKAFKVREAEYSSRLDQSRLELSKKEEYLRLILTDGDFLERVVRQKLGYARPDEKIFLFEQPKR